jgi:hypothetical protein
MSIGCLLIHHANVLEPFCDSQVGSSCTLVPAHSQPQNASHDKPVLIQVLYSTHMNKLQHWCQTHYTDYPCRNRIAGMIVLLARDLHAFHVMQYTLPTRLRNQHTCCATPALCSMQREHQPGSEYSMLNSYTQHPAHPTPPVRWHRPEEEGHASQLWAGGSRADEGNLLLPGNPSCCHSGARADLPNDTNCGSTTAQHSTAQHSTAQHSTAQHISINP